MKGLAELTKTTLIGGLLVVLPIYLSVLLLAKTLSGLLALLSPVTAAIPAAAQFRHVLAILIVLVPSVPTPAAGALFILPRERVHPIDIPFTQAVTVISKWGVGAGAMARGVTVRS